jgi:hypothetical protein
LVKLFFSVDSENGILEPPIDEISIVTISDDSAHLVEENVVASNQVNSISPASVEKNTIPSK